jgi:putative tryptophan/tyrosine transport system substrate-binding protein
MKRREFITLIGAAWGWPITVRAQQAESVRRIGMLIHYSQADREGKARIAAFLDTLQRLGWTDGRNIRIEYRWSAGDTDRERASAAELVRSTPEVIVVAGWTALAELQRLTSTIPVVFTQVSDTVGSGFVASLARAGGNISGFQNFEPAIGGKWLGVLKEAAPQMRRAAILFGSDSLATVAMLQAAEAVAPSLGIQVTAVDVLTEGEIDHAIGTFASQSDGGLIITSHPSLIANRASTIALAARHRLPAVYPFRYFAAEGGLMSYGPDQIAQWRGGGELCRSHSAGREAGRAAGSGAGQVRLVINLKAANVIGLNIPPSLPLRADEVIE